MRSPCGSQVLRPARLQPYSRWRPADDGGGGGGGSSGGSEGDGGHDGTGVEQQHTSHRSGSSSGGSSIRSPLRGSALAASISPEALGFPGDLAATLAPRTLSPLPPLGPAPLEYPGHAGAKRPQSPRY